MNKKQMVVLWIMAIALSAISFMYGIQYEELFYTFVMPIVLLGGTLIVQLRDSSAGSEARKGPGINALILAANTALLLHLLVTQESATAAEFDSSTLESTVSGVSSEIATLDGKIDGLERQIDNVQLACMSRRLP